MSEEDAELIRGSGNLYRDLGYADADLRQAKALLAGEIIKVLERENLSTRQAEALTGVGHAEFSRIRNVRLERFTLDRLLTILEKLGQRVEVSFVVRPRREMPEVLLTY